MQGNLRLCVLARRKLLFCLDMGMGPIQVQRRRRKIHTPYNTTQRRGTSSLFSLSESEFVMRNMLFSIFIDFCLSKGNCSAQIATLETRLLLLDAGHLIL